MGAHARCFGRVLASSAQSSQTTTWVVGAGRPPCYLAVAPPQGARGLHPLRRLHPVGVAAVIGQGGAWLLRSQHHPAVSQGPQVGRGGCLAVTHGGSGVPGLEPPCVCCGTQEAVTVCSWG